MTEGEENGVVIYVCNFSTLLFICIGMKLGMNTQVPGIVCNIRVIRSGWIWRVNQLPIVFPI